MLDLISRDHQRLTDTPFEAALGLYLSALATATSKLLRRPPAENVPGSYDQLRLRLQSAVRGEKITGTRNWVEDEITPALKELCDATRNLHFVMNTEGCMQALT